MKSPDRAIFDRFTGNAMLDNALMAAMIHTGCKHLSELTPRLVKQSIDEELASLYKRMKVYFMVFTNNGPLHNNSMKKHGLEIYLKLMHHILDEHDVEGDFVCQITGLRFSRSFAQLYQEVVAKNDFKGNIDVSLSRCWIPLAGSLGSEAQALPQAKFTFQIAPVCVVMMQFIPLVSTLYKGRVLLVDTADKDFALRYLKKNYEEIQNIIDSKSKHDTIKNVKFTKGNYIQKALELLADKKRIQSTIHLNLWSFTNATNAAVCEIDRIPDTLLLKLQKLNTMLLRKELFNILANPVLQTRFLESLEENRDFWGLYKSKHAEPVSMDFYEEYHQCIGNKHRLRAARYIAKLMQKLQEEKHKKLFLKNDAYRDPDYLPFVLSILVKACKAGLWTMRQHVEILDDKDTFPISSNFYKILKFIHFYYKNEEVEEDFSLSELSYSPAINDDEPLLKLLASLQNIIDEDINGKRSKEKFLTGQDYRKLPLDGIVARATLNLPVVSIVPVLFNENYQKRIIGLLDLLRILYASGEKLKVIAEWPVKQMRIYPLSNIDILSDFCDDFIKYKKAKGRSDDKINKEINADLAKADYSSFAKWLRAHCKYISQAENLATPKRGYYDYEFLTTDITGADNFAFASFTIRYKLLKYFQQHSHNLN